MLQAAPLKRVPVQVELARTYTKIQKGRIESVLTRVFKVKIHSQELILLNKRFKGY